MRHVDIYFNHLIRVSRRKTTNNYLLRLTRVSLVQFVIAHAIIGRRLLNYSKLQLNFAGTFYATQPADRAPVLVAVKTPIGRR